MSGLPNGWGTAALDQLIAPDGLLSDGDWVETKDQDPNGEIRLLQLADIGDGFFIDKSNRFINEEQFERLKCTEVLERDILIARMPDPLGRACLAPTLQRRSITVVDIAIVRPGQFSVESTWLMRFLNSPSVREEIKFLSSGTTRRRISRGNLTRLRLPVPPLNEQKRIADKLDAVLARVDACRERLDRVPGILKRFRQAVLAAATSGELTKDWRAEQVARMEPQAESGDAVHEVAGRLYAVHGNPDSAALHRGYDLPDSWGESTVGEMIERIDAGLNVQCVERPPDDGEIGLVKISAVTWGVFDDNKSKTLPAGTSLPESSRIRQGDFLISRANTLELVGACVLVQDVKRAVYLSDKVLRLALADGLKAWLLYVLRSDRGRRQIEALASGNQLSMRNLSQANLKSVRVPMPREDERQEIVRRVETLFASADRLEARYQAARAKVERLTPALLAKAFRGELVPQDPDDEPADELLARIKAQAAGSQPRPAPRGRVDRALARP